MKDRTSEETTKRPERVPLVSRNILTAPQRHGYVRRFVNNEPGRINGFKAAGYEIVQGDAQIGDPKIGKGLLPGSAVAMPVGGGQNAVLMEIKQEYYDEDQKVKQDKITREENDMRQELNSGKNGFQGSVTF